MRSGSSLSGHLYFRQRLCEDDPREPVRLEDGVSEPLAAGSLEVGDDVVAAEHREGALHLGNLLQVLCDGVKLASLCPNQHASGDQCNQGLLGGPANKRFPRAVRLSVRRATLWTAASCLPSRSGARQVP